MYNHRHRTARYRKDIYTKGKGRWIASEDDYNCSNYNLGRQKYRQQCSSHGIQTKAVNALVLETIKETCNYAVANEGEFKAVICKLSSDRKADAGNTQATGKGTSRNSKLTGKRDFLNEKAMTVTVIVFFYAVIIVRKSFISTETNQSYQSIHITGGQRP